MDLAISISWVPGPGPQPQMPRALQLPQEALLALGSSSIERCASPTETEKKGKKVSSETDFL